MEDYKRSLQLHILEIVKDIDKVCKKNNIEYCLAYGSVLGSVRHKGFIPWDDDFDIMIKYDEYEKFITCCINELDSNKYFIQNDNTESNFYLRFTKIRNITTTYIEESNKNEKIQFGVYVDVFPVVGCPKNPVKREILKICRACAMSVDRNIINNKFFYCIFKFFTKTIGKEKIRKWAYKKCISYSCDSCDELISIFDGDGFEINVFNKNDVFPTRKEKFEDTKLPIPRNYDIYLKKLYGDYMKIPSEEEIKKNTHTPFYINLKEGNRVKYEEEVNNK